MPYFIFRLAYVWVMYGLITSLTRLLSKWFCNEVYIKMNNCANADRVHQHAQLAVVQLCVLMNSKF